MQMTDVIRIALKGDSLKLSEIFHSIPLVSIVICVHCCWLGYNGNALHVLRQFMTPSFFFWIYLKIYAPPRYGFSENFYVIILLILVLHSLWNGVRTSCILSATF